MDSDERLMILKMLQEGKITAEEALNLINALDGEELNDYGIGFDQTDACCKLPEQLETCSTKSDKGNPAKRILGSLFNLGGAPYKFSKNFSIPVSDGISFTLKGKNGHIDLISSSEPDIRLDIKWGKRVNDAGGVDIAQKSESEWEMIIADDVRWVSVEGYIPTRYYNKVRLYTSNGQITICPINCFSLEAGTSNAQIESNKVCSEDLIHMTSSNGHVNMSNCEASSAIVRTCNAHIGVADGNYGQIDLMTSNAHVKMHGVKAQIGKVQSSNGRITIERCCMDDLFAKTSNADIGVNSIDMTQGAQQAKVEAISSNGNIAVSVMNKEDKAYKVKAGTSHGKAMISLPGIEVALGHQADAVGCGYDSAKKRMHIIAGTSNGNITID